MRTHILHGLLLLVCYHPPSPPAIDCAQALLAIPNVAVNVQVGVYNLYSSHSHLLTSYPGSLWEGGTEPGYETIRLPKSVLDFPFQLWYCMCFYLGLETLWAGPLCTLLLQKNMYIHANKHLYLCHCRINLVIHHCTMQHGRDTQMLSQLS